MATVSTGALGATLGLSFLSAPAYTAPTTGIQYATTLAVNWRHLGSSTGSFAVGAPIGTLRFSNPPVRICCRYAYLLLVGSGLLVTNHKTIDQHQDQQRPRQKSLVKAR